MLRVRQTAASGAPDLTVRSPPRTTWCQTRRWLHEVKIAILPRVECCVSRIWACAGPILSLTVAQILKIQKIVDDKKWTAFNGIYVEDSTVQADLMMLVDPLPRDEADLIISLLEDYLIIREYALPCRTLLQKLVSFGMMGSVVAPLKLASDTKTKSGQLVAYQMQKVSKGTALEFTDSPFDAGYYMSTKHKIIVDDFIGTGDQFFEMLDDIDRKLHFLSFFPDLVLCLAIQEEAKARIEAEGIMVEAVHVRPPGIRNHVSKNGLIPGDVYKLYDRLEARVANINGYERGYGQAEALVTVHDTPDNTLPVFWKRDATWPAPFPR